MKAKELADQYKRGRMTLQEVCHNMIVETKTLAENRGVKTDAGLAAIIREMDDKWRAFARKVDGTNPDGFKLALHAVVPVSKELFP